MIRLSLIFLAACTVADKTDVGPVIHVDLEASIGSVTDQDTTPSIFLPTGDSSYSIDVSISTSAGTSTSDTFSYSPVSSFTTSFMVGTTALPDSADQYTDDGYTDATYNRNTPFMLPASAKGGKFHVHIEAADDRGLAANLIDFSVSLE